MSVASAAFESAALSLDDGVLEVRLHTDGGPLVWGEVPHRELPELWAAIAGDPEVRVVVLTGTGEVFCERMDPSGWRGLATPAGWDLIYREGRRLLQGLLDLEVPMVAAVNGPARVHAELLVLGDVVVASETAVFQDAAHFAAGAVPGDGAHVVWPQLLGPSRGRYFLLCNEEIGCDEARRLGFVHEVVPPGEVVARAHEVARRLASAPELTLRYTRAALLQPLREAMLAQLGHGLLLEGAALGAAAAARRRRDPAADAGTG